MAMFVKPYPYSTAKTYIGSMGQEFRMEILANNLANAGATGFKRDVPVFEGFMVKATQVDFEQGHFQETGNRLDLALSGPGFFQIDTPDGARYTRNGSFTTTSDGEIVTMHGHPLAGAGEVPPNTVDLVVAEDGRIMADGIQIGEIEIVEFEDRRLLRKDGYNNYAPKVEDVTPQEAAETTVSQGYLEMSNVDPVLGSVNLIDTLRTYEAFQKTIHSFEETDTKCVNEVGRLV
jgi:flagellar basal-body rod protein FlgG